ncbi:MAG: UDP-3-O-(3-hydroxymyristoyl)glucosamine N-acyltransferase, partial [Cyclobacteriaceae bacterium]|nr:UDP-3-O-(3-hydroxymyristoyl)glucosamine N-acyltransferase [Cyclobacteriaceae bacterium]
MKFKIKDIALLLGGEVVGDDSIEIDMIGSIEHASKNQLSFLANLKYEHFLYTTQAGAVLVNKDFTPKSSFNTSLIKVDDAYTAFSKILEEYKKIKLYSLKGIEESVVIGNNVNYGEDFYLGSFSYIMNNVTIGNNVKIHPQCYIGENVTIGDNTIIYPGVKIFEDTVIGNGCIIKSGAVIGSEGFGFAPQPDGSYRAVPQLGNVIIEDEVSIGANTTIDCATLSGESTRIKRGSKIDNLVQLGHNVQIGVNTVIAAETGIAGSTIIGDNCMIGG